MEMIKYGNSFIVDGPHVIGRAVEWTVGSQSSDSKTYKVSITPCILMSTKSKRDAYKNFFIIVLVKTQGNYVK